MVVLHINVLLRSCLLLGEFLTSTFFHRIRGLTDDLLEREYMATPITSFFFIVQFYFKVLRSCESFYICTCLVTINLLWRFWLDQLILLIALCRVAQNKKIYTARVLENNFCNLKLHVYPGDFLDSKQGVWGKLSEQVTLNLSKSVVSLVLSDGEYLITLFFVVKIE